MESKELTLNKKKIKVFKTGKITANGRSLSHSNEEYPRVIINKKMYYIHVLVQETFSGRKKKKDEVVDHIDRNTKNLHFDNLRFATIKENSRNRSKSKNKTSKYKGVYYSNSRSKFVAKMEVDGKRIFLGYHKFEEDAALAYNEGALKHFGNKFSALNEVKRGEYKTYPEKTNIEEIEIKKDEKFKKVTLNSKSFEISNYGNIRINERNKIVIKNGSLRKEGYRQIKINGKHFRIHRLVAFAWLGMKIDSKDQVDHINCKRDDNRLSNLRILTSAQNAHNKVKRKNLSSKFLGVYKVKDNGSKPWRAMIQKNGKKTHIGYYSTQKEASKAYRKEQETLLSC